MPTVSINIENTNNHYIYNLSLIDIQNLLTYVNSISKPIETDLSEQIEISLKQVKQIQDGEIARKSLRDLLNE